MKLPSTLTPREVRLIRADLKAMGRAMPKVGWCVRLSNGGEVCRDGHGFYLTRPFPGVTTPLAKGNLCVPGK